MRSMYKLVVVFFAIILFVGCASKKGAYQANEAPKDINTKKRLQRSLRAICFVCKGPRGERKGKALRSKPTACVVANLS